MNITINCNSKEIAALIFYIQEQQKDLKKDIEKSIANQFVAGLSQAGKTIETSIIR